MWGEIRLIHKYVTGKLKIFHTFFCVLTENCNARGSVWVDFYPFFEQRTIFRELLELLRGLHLECAETCRRIIMPAMYIF